MGRTHRSIFLNEGDIRTDPLGEELIILADAIKNGFSVSSPFALILRTIADLLLLSKDLIESGELRLTPDVKMVKILEDRHDPLKFTYANEVNKGAPGLEGLPQWYHSGSVASKTITKKGQKVESPILAEFMEINAITFYALATNPNADPYFMFGPRGSSQDTKKIIKVSHKNLMYWRRLRARYKKSTRSTLK